MIPKTCFSCWIGGDPPKNVVELTKKAKRVVESAPNWIYVFHGPEVLERYGKDPYIRRLLAMRESLAFVVDRIRLLLLRDHGGFWVDSDCDFQRPMSLLDKMADDPKTDFLTGVRNPWRPHVALHRGVAMVDNTVMGSAKGGKMVNRLLSLYTADNPKQTGHDAGVEVLRSIDESVILLNYRYFYAHPPDNFPETILYHDHANIGSWTPKATKLTDHAIH